MAVCDVACQRQKQLDGLFSALKQAEGNMMTDPVSYEKAKISYFTLKDGQEWLHGEKERLAKQSVGPVLAEYDQKFQSLQTQLASAYAAQKTPEKESEVGDEEDTRYLHKQILSEHDKYGVAQRLSEIGSPILMGYSWIPLLLDLIIAFSILAILYYAFVVGKITQYFVSPVANTL
jgi:hypothetical protein